MLHHASYRQGPGYTRVHHWVLAQVDGLARLRNLLPNEPVHRYQWAQPGDMIHVETKQMAPIERVGPHHW